MDMPTQLPGWITPAQYRALARVVAELDLLGVLYQISGGLAGNLHGSTWPVDDVDLDVPSEALDEIAARFAGSPGVIVRGPARYRDEEFDLDLLELTLDGVEFDLSGTDGAAVFTPDGARHELDVDPSAAEVRRLGALSLRVLPLEELIRYKRLLDRRADLADLERLR